MKSGDQGRFASIFGPGSESLISSGDDVTDKAQRERFLKGYEEKNSLEMKGESEAILLLGKDDWPLPIPIRKKGPAWSFDTKAGKEELLTRRIGRNELNAIDILQAYVIAQREYAAKDWNGDGVHPYAQKLRSAAGKKDGLYWNAGKGEEESPFGPLAAQAAREGYSRADAKSDEISPLHGYYFKILKAQGKYAPGGAYDYVVKGNMILGFGLVAYPAKYGSSGIMTFIVNQEGVVYQKDLGKGTAKTAGAMKRYDPDPTWDKVEAGSDVPDCPAEVVLAWNRIDRKRRVRFLHSRQAAAVPREDLTSIGPFASRWTSRCGKAITIPARSRSL